MNKKSYFSILYTNQFGWPRFRFSEQVLYLRFGAVDAGPGRVLLLAEGDLKVTQGPRDWVGDGGVSQNQ